MTFVDSWLLSSSTSSSSSSCSAQRRREKGRFRRSTSSRRSSRGASRLQPHAGRVLRAVFENTNASSKERQSPVSPDTSCGDSLPKMAGTYNGRRFSSKRVQDELHSSTPPMFRLPSRFAAPVRVICGLLLMCWGVVAKDFYATLGAKKTDPLSRIKKLYRKLALKWHPDKGDANESETKKAERLKKFQEINNAYATLSDPKKRKNYDEFGEDPTRPGQAAEGQTGGQQGFGDNMADIFAQFFGGGRPGGGGASFQFNSGGGQQRGKQQAKQESPLYDDDEHVSEIQGFEDYQNNVNSARDHYAEQFVIKFYQDGHTPSKQFSKPFSKLAKGYDGAANFFAVGCNRHKKVCDKAGVSSYPSIKFYGAGEKTETFSGAKTYDGLLKWVKKTLPDKTVTLKTKHDKDKFMSVDGAKVILFVEKPNTPPRLTLLSVQFGKVQIGVLSKKDSPKLFKEFLVPRKQKLPAFLNVHDGTWTKKSIDEIPGFFGEVQKQYREEMLTPKFLELTFDEYNPPSNKCGPTDSNYCILVYTEHTELLKSIFLDVAKTLMKDPVRVVSVNPKTNIEMKTKLTPIVSKLPAEEVVVLLWRPKRQRWKQFDQNFVELYQKDKAKEGIVTWVREAMDSGVALQNRHDEL
ncbi:unnamed protein product [Amoebophrya sp. A25]|nr:unnamed protein product [Amoebophrya sp. A25]|eukprot:GSA25T00000961001.1